jgi:hypothetical protein
MVSRSLDGDDGFEDLASAHGELLPWSDDQTTSIYRPSEHRYLHGYVQADTLPPRAAAAPGMDEMTWLDTSSGWDLSPIIIEIADSVPPPAPTQRVRAPTYPALARVDAPVLARNDATQHLRMQVDAELEDNPFARPHANLAVWSLTTLMAAGLCCAVLFGRVLLHASIEPIVPPAAVTPAPQPIVPPVAASPDLGTQGNPAPETSTSPFAAEQPTAAVTAWHEKQLARYGRHVSSWHSRARHEQSEPQDTESSEPAPNEEPATPNAAPLQAASPGSPGTLRINSRPWSQVFVDGRSIGMTPQLNVSVPAGEHSVHLVNPEFGMTKTFTVSVSAGESVTRVETLEDNNQ